MSVFRRTLQECPRKLYGSRCASSSPLMMAFSALPILLAFVTLAYAAETFDVDSSQCTIKAVDGAYNYDPTSGKGPSHWGSLGPDYTSCKNGQMQSPINLPLDVTYKPLSAGPRPMLQGSKFALSASVSNWALSCATEGACGFTTFARTNFTLFNIHFHSPSEHTLDGTQYPLEVHFVHVGPGGALLVVSTMFKYSRRDEYSYKILAGRHMEDGKSTFLGQILEGISGNKKRFKVNPERIIDASKGYCSYSGSLTTPPCTEGVTFVMSMNVETVSKRQVHAYTVSAGANYDGNNRPLQNFNDREVICYV